MAAQVSRAPSAAGPVPQAGGPSSRPAYPPRPKTAYSTDVRDLHPGPRNRLLLALRSGLDAEIDWALPRLVAASYEHTEHFRLEVWVDSVAALRVWPERWLEQLEREAALRHAGEAGSNDEVVRTAMGGVPEWARDATTERRAAECLLILRNASVNVTNAKVISRTTFPEVLLRFFSLPHAFLLDIALREPEPFTHMLVIFNSIVYHLFPAPNILRIFAEVLPALVVDTRDAAVLAAALPILIVTLPLPVTPPPPARLVPHLLRVLVAELPAHLPDLALDLLVSLTLLPQHARALLALPDIAAHLATLVGWLERGARAYVVHLDPPAARQASLVPNPAGAQARAEAATRRRLVQHEKDGHMMQAANGPGLVRPVGAKPPVLNPSFVEGLYKMTEPRRSIAWMHETFTYSSTSQLLQVAFWHAYRDFFTHPSSAEQLLSASEVIKNVSIAFPFAKPKVVVDEAAGERKFVIDGIGFRHAAENEDLFVCAWQDCAEPHGHSSSTSLLVHIHEKHASPLPDACAWGGCTQPRPTLSHMATHVPYPMPPASPLVTVDARAPAPFAEPLARPAPFLPRTRHPLRFAAALTPIDAQRQPAGAPFLAALVVRNLARALRAELAAAAASGAGDAASRKKKALQDERYGLPIPDSVLREEEKEEDEAKGRDRDEAGALGAAERERAQAAFAAVEERILRVMGTNIVGLPQYLADALLW